MVCPTSRKKTFSVPKNTPKPAANPCCRINKGIRASTDQPGHFPATARNPKNINSKIPKLILDERKTKTYQDIYKENLATRKQKKKNAIIYSVIAAFFVIILGYGTFHDSTNTSIKQTSEMPRDLLSGTISQQNDQQANTFQFNENNFNSSIYKIDDFKELQKNLKTIGYEISKIDGIIGPNTIKECNRFRVDFSYFSKLNSTANL